MAEARTNKKLKSVEWSELYVSARGVILLIEGETKWLLGNGFRTGVLETGLACTHRSLTIQGNSVQEESRDWNPS